VLGRRGRQAGPLGPTACARKKKRPLAWVACGLKGCWAGGRKEKEREREREKDFLFFKISFQIHFLNIQTSIKQNPCIRIMMHKHLLFLNYFGDV
jgi:hypothetical protein